MLAIHCGNTLKAEGAEFPIKVEGRAIDEQGNVLVGAAVRITVPATQGLSIDAGSGRLVFEGKTDDQGRYRIQVPLNGETSLTVEVTKPGFRSAIESSSQGNGFFSGSPIKVGQTFNASFIMHPSLYVAGAVVDEAGRPVPGTEVFGANSHVKTDEHGHFEVFTFPLQREPGRNGELYFQHAQFLSAELADVYAINATDCASLRIVLKAGRKISGRIIDAMGNPAVGAVIEARFDSDWSARRATLTGRDGRFVQSGLLSEEVTLLVQALPIKQHLKKRLSLDHDLAEQELRLEPIALEEPADTRQLFGMKLATITPAVREAYFLDPGAVGVVILDPGKELVRIGVDDLCEGDYFWDRHNGRNRIKTLRDFVDLLRDRIARANQAPPYRVDLAYACNHVDWTGTKGVHMQLTADDLRQLDVAAAELARLQPVNPVVKHGLLGVHPVDVVEAGLACARIESVVPDTPAARAGLAPGEIILKVDDVEIHSGSELREAIRSRKPGDKVTLKLLRTQDGTQQNVVVTLDES
jgi:hypothetical protein